MIGPRVGHRSRRAEGARLRVVDLGRREELAVLVVRAASDNQDPAVLEQRRGRLIAWRRHRAGRAERAGPRIEELRCGGLRAVVGDSARDQDAAVGEQGRGMPGAAVHRPRRGERARRRVVDLGGDGHGREPGPAAGAPAGDQDPTVGEQRGAVEASRVRHRSGRAERAGPRVEQLGRGDRMVGSLGVDAPRDEDATIAEQGRGVALARRRHRAGRAERACLRVEQLGRGEKWTGVGGEARGAAAGDQDAAVGEQGRGGARRGRRPWSRSRVNLPVPGS